MKHFLFMLFFITKLTMKLEAIHVLENDESFKQNSKINFKAIIFDCDGTLVDSEYAHYLGWQYAMQRQGSDLALDEYYFFIGKSMETNAKLLAQKVGRDCATELLKDKRAYYQILQDAGLPPIEATTHFVHRLANEKLNLGLKLGVASAAKKEEIISNLKHLKIAHLFDIVISGQDDLSDYFDLEGTNKPKPYIYLHTAKLLGIDPSECVVIEDSYSGVCAGVAAGCFTIAVPNQFTEQQDLSVADLKINSFDNMDVDSLLQMAEDYSSSKENRKQ